MQSFTLVAHLLLVLFFTPLATSTTYCISKRQQSELPYCCKTEPLVSDHILTKCQEEVAAKHNPGFEQFEVCLQQCVFEELGVVEGAEVRVEKLYALAEAFPADYRQAVHLAIDECSKRLEKSKEMYEKMNTECSLLGFAVDRCVRLLIFENCPTGRWSAAVACTKVRQGVRFC